MALRPDLDAVAAMVPRGSRVLDLGCGDGALLDHLIREKDCDGTGVEISDEGFHACVARGVPVMVGDIDRGLADVEDGAFDVVILSQTLQATQRPTLVLHEMMRVGRVGIVSFPNFGHWRLRWSLAARIEQLPRDVGVNALLRSSPSLVTEWPTDRESVLADLDTPEDYAFWQQKLANKPE